MIELEEDVKLQIDQVVRQQGGGNIDDFEVEFGDELLLGRFFKYFSENESSIQRRLEESNCHLESKRKRIILRKLIENSHVSDVELRSLKNIEFEKNSGVIRAVCPRKNCGSRIIIQEKSRGNFHDSTFVKHVMRHFHNSDAASRTDRMEVDETTEEVGIANPLNTVS